MCVWAIPLLCLVIDKLLTQEHSPLLEAYFIYTSYKYCFQQLQLKFPGVPVPG